MKPRGTATSLGCAMEQKQVASQLRQNAPINCATALQ